MKVAIILTASALILLPAVATPVAAAAAASAKNDLPVLSSAKAELIGRVEDFFLHNFHDITWRKSLAWGDVWTEADGVRSISYDYEAKIWDKETLIISQVFTFAADGKFIGVKQAPGFPKKKQPVVVDVTTRKGMMALVEDFFSKNYRDIAARETIEWGEVAKDAKGNSTIRYKYKATIGQEKKLIEQVFTFDEKGEFVSVKNVDG